MTRHRLIIAGAAALALVAAFLAGRYSYRPRVVERVKVEEKEVIRVEWRDRMVEKRVAGPVRVVTRTVEKPGAEREVVRWVERGPVTTEIQATWDGAAAGASETTTTASKVTEAERPGWAVGASALVVPRDLGAAPRLGLELDRRLWGTLWLGARASAAPDLGGLRLGLAARMEW